MLFFASQQSSTTSGSCSGTGNNDFWGCGNYGSNAFPCGAFTFYSGDLCSGFSGQPGAGWSCGTNGLSERTNVTKTSTTGGGVLCCKD